MNQIGLGCGCHWCTEGIFRSLTGISNVQQGWISAVEAPDFSEAVIVDFNPTQIPLSVLIDIHLHTHSSTSNHRLRAKYWSAVYVFDAQEYTAAAACLTAFQPGFDQPLVTQVFQFGSYRPSPALYQDYFYVDPEKPFCSNFILPRIRQLLQDYGAYTNAGQLRRLPL